MSTLDLTYDLDLRSDQTSCLQVKLAHQESEVAALLKKIPRGPSEMSTMRCRAEELREGTLCDYRPVLPLMLASFIFDVLCAPGMVPDSSTRELM